MAVEGFRACMAKDRAVSGGQPSTTVSAQLKLKHVERLNCFSRTAQRRDAAQANFTPSYSWRVDAARTADQLINRSVSPPQLPCVALPEIESGVQCVISMVDGNSAVCCRTPRTP